MVLSQRSKVSKGGFGWNVVGDGGTAFVVGCKVVEFGPVMAGPQLVESVSSAGVRHNQYQARKDANRNGKNDSHWDRFDGLFDRRKSCLLNGRVGGRVRRRSNERCWDDWSWCRIMNDCRGNFHGRVCWSNDRRNISVSVWRREGSWFDEGNRRRWCRSNIERRSSWCRGRNDRRVCGSKYWMYSWMCSWMCSWRCGWIDGLVRREWSRRNRNNSDSGRRNG